MSSANKTPHSVPSKFPSPRAASPPPFFQSAAGGCGQVWRPDLSTSPRSSWLRLRASRGVLGLPEAERRPVQDHHLAVME